MGGVGLWMLALLWLPPYLVGGAVWMRWALAALIVLVYGAGLLLAEGLRTRLAGIFSAQWPRSVQLFPYGAATAYPLRSLEPTRAAGVAVVAPLVLAVLGVGYWQLSNLFTGLDIRSLAGAAGALAALHLGAAALHLLPGLPLAAAWLGIALSGWISNDTDRGVVLTRWLGLLVSLGLAATGALLLLNGDDWAPALGLLALGWAVREGGAEVGRRQSTRQMLAEVSAHAVMVPPTRAVDPDSSLAAIFWTGTHLPANALLSVADADGRFLGLLPASRTDELLQGTWAQTSARAVMIPAGALTAVEPATPLLAVLAAFARQTPAEQDGAAGASLLDTEYVPVLKQGKLLGVINREQVAEYERLGARSGVQEAAVLHGLTTPGRGRVAWAAALLIVFAGVLVLSAIGHQTVGATLVAPPTAASSAGMIAFGTVAPADGALVGRGQQTITVPIRGAVPVVHVTITLNGDPLAVTMSPPSGGLAVVASARAAASALGLYQVHIHAQTQAGASADHSWSFRVVSGLAAGTPTPAAEVPPATPAPTVPTGPTPVQDATHRLFPATGHFVSGAFLAFWDQHGGLAIFGYPLTEPQTTRSAAGPLAVQYFERAQMEQYPGGPVLLGLLGLAVHPADPPAAPLAGAQYFKATGHNLGGGFREFWETHGGLPIFGYPISEERGAVIAGQTETVQYFERARFAYHPERAGTPWGITLGALGRQVRARQP
ncbi:MAG: hypothetical protein M3010_11010 [Candidatus Dormibacteraeota bacterium]|nr:hypothetical protein [Candidatus Dormibacteraeota bacterium]